MPFDLANSFQQSESKSKEGANIRKSQLGLDKKSSGTNIIITNKDGNGGGSRH